MREELLGCLEDHAALLHAEGSTELAVRIAAAASVSRERLGLARAPRSEQRWQRQLDALRQAVTGAAFDAAWDEGRNWEVDKTVRSALSTQVELLSA